MSIEIDSGNLQLLARDRAISGSMLHVLLWCWSIASRQGWVIVPVSQSAEIFGVTPSTFYRMRAALVAKGLLRLHDGKSAARVLSPRHPWVLNDHRYEVVTNDGRTTRDSDNCGWEKESPDEADIPMGRGRKNARGMRPPRGVPR